MEAWLFAGSHANLPSLLPEFCKALGKERGRPEHHVMELGFWSRISQIWAGEVFMTGLFCALEEV